MAEQVFQQYLQGERETPDVEALVACDHVEPVDREGVAAKVQAPPGTEAVV